jgi:transposase
MPTCTFVEIPEEEQAPMLAARRRARDGSLLALDILLWGAATHTPTDIAAVWFCSRSSVYRTGQASRTGTLGLEHDAQGRLVPPVRTSVLLPTLRRALGALLRAAPRASGWCRTRWSCATLAATLHAKRGLTVSAETLRRWLHAIDWGWKRAQLVAKDDAPHRAARLARLRFVCEPLRRWEALVVADERELHLLPKGGYAWLPNGTPLAVRTPGRNEKPSLAGALELSTGTRRHCLGARTTNALFRDLVAALDEAYPALQFQRVSGVVDHDQIHTAKAVEPWLAHHPRFSLRFWPTYWPRANPIERVFGDGHDLGTRNHPRQRLRDLVADVEAHVPVNRPWPEALSDIYDEPAVTAAVEKMTGEEPSKFAA